MLLAVDIGNSNIALGVFDGGTLRFRAKLAAAVERSADEYAAILISHRGIWRQLADWAVENA